MLRLVLLKALKIATRRSRSVVVFQNGEDRDYLVSKGIAQLQQARIIAGSGIDTE